jgi:hypothetical protein
VSWPWRDASRQDSDTTSSSFFEQTASTIPRSASDTAEALEGRIGLARGAALSQDKPFDAVVADNTAPERVIEIEDQAFTREPARGRDNPSHEIAVKRRNKRPDSLFRLMPVNRVAPGGAPGPCRLAVHVDQKDSGGRCRVE